MRLGAIVLAAGRSMRMGNENKLVARIDGKALVCRVVEGLADSAIEEIVVVTGFDAPAVRDVLDPYDIRFVHNEDYRTGMGGSIARGVAGTIETLDVDGILLCLGDMPGIDGVIVELLARRFARADSIVVPVRAGRRGHPVLFGADHFSALAALQGTRGARRLLEERPECVIEVDCGDAEIHSDIDTPADLDAYRAMLKAR
jgi:molybdenum cofactor cytidylyltransferase